jgi:hypothetical protein
MPNRDKDAVLEQIRLLVADMSPKERLTVIETIASLDSESDQVNERHSPEEQQLIAEQEQWFARPVAERVQYRNQFVAVYQGKVVDHDPNQRELYIRVRQRFGAEPVLIINGDWDATPELTIHSTHFVV